MASCGLGLCLMVAGSLWPALAQPADPTTDGPPPSVLRLGADQNIVLHRSGDPRLPHLFSAEDTEAVAPRRPWAISLNVAMPGAHELDRHLQHELDDRRLSEQVLIEEFKPPHAPRCTELQIGSRVPVAIVQAVVRSLLPLDQRWSVQFVDEEAGNGAGATQRVYIGGMVQRPCALAPPAKLRELAAPGLTLPALHRLLRAINGTDRQNARGLGTTAAA